MRAEKPKSHRADDKTQAIPIPGKVRTKPTQGAAKPYFDRSRVDRIMKHYENQAYHHVDHTESYNKPWVEGETQMTLEHIAKEVEFIKRCMGMAGVAILATLLITLIK